MICGAEGGYGTKNVSFLLEMTWNIPEPAKKWWIFAGVN
jgi:hypothetical protein